MAFIFSLILMHMSYPLVLARISRSDLRNPLTKRIMDITTSEVSPGLPFISVVIPVYNEELVIERRINNIFESSYPKEKLEIIIVDSGSKDKTRNIIKEKFSKEVILLREEQRKGKAHAINLAIKKSRGEIIIITDGPTLYNRDTIIQLVDSLKNSSVGGVSALYNIPNADVNQITASENAFWSYKDKITVLESKAYSTSWLSGEACAFKKSIITRVDEDTLADDSNIALQIISKGYRVVVNENSYFTEKSPSEVYEYFKIKSRRVLGGLIETLRFKFI
jgi:poly-beta-1,6-N-acetyl-D-glucosamine synthase